MSYIYADDPRNDVVALTPEGRRVLDVGCGRGTFGAALKEADPRREVYGLELNREAADVAATRLDAAACGPFPEAVPTEWVGFDVVTFLDVLEHFADPWDALRATTALLADGGVVFSMIPNVRWLPVLFDLAVRGRWTYTDTGVLDRTHLRFFTESSAVELFREAGYEVLDVRPHELSPKAQPVNRLLRGRLDGLIAMHFAITARPTGAS